MRRRSVENEVGRSVPEPVAVDGSSRVGRRGDVDAVRVEDGERGRVSVESPRGRERVRVAAEEETPEEHSDFVGPADLYPRGRVHERGEIEFLRPGVAGDRHRPDFVGVDREGAIDRGDREGEAFRDADGGGDSVSVRKDHGRIGTLERLVERSADRLAYPDRRGTRTSERRLHASENDRQTRAPPVSRASVTTWTL